MRHRGYGRELALDGVEATLDAPLRGEHLLHLRGIHNVRGFRRLKADHAAATDHRSTDQ
jgi:hypothetical protein